MTHQVFLSVGRTSTPQQAAFVQAIIDFLADHELVARTVGRTDFAHHKPLQHIAAVMGDCSGTIVVAFERLHIIEGIELRDHITPLVLNGVNLPTVWNQIEAAMAYMLGQPLLAIVESGLREEGLLEQDYDWYAKWIKLDPGCLTDPEFLSTFQAWQRKVESYQAGQTPPTPHA
jgi:hypothetical protein